jgi:hypothetical protein
MIIYKITSPSGKQYIGQSSQTFYDKCKWYKKYSKFDKSNRLIFNAIRKYGIDNMKFELIEENRCWTKEELNHKEVYYIEKFNTYHTHGLGYNMTFGGDGLDSKSASDVITKWHKSMNKNKKEQRSQNCSYAQKKRFSIAKDSAETREKKKRSHQGYYIIESPDGVFYNAPNGIKEFVEQHGGRLGISYWQLFNAYRKTYSNTKTVRKKKNLNNWKVLRIDK